MITIGEFARLGRVSVRMLRHYDAIGLLVPDHVDAHSGYRHYTLDQLRRLNRIVALKELGLNLDQVATIVDELVSADELRAMLRLRKAELEQQIRDSGHRLDRVAARLRLIDVEDHVNQTSVITKTVTAQHLLGLSEVVATATQEDIGPVVGPLFARAAGTLGAAGHAPSGPAVGWYAPAPDVSEDALRAHAAFPADVDEVDGLDRIDVPGGSVASLVHRGPMETIDVAYQTLRRWAHENDHKLTGEGREVYLEMGDDPAGWVTEVQLYLA